MFRHSRVIFRSLRTVCVILNCNKICLFLYIKKNMVKILTLKSLTRYVYKHYNAIQNYTKHQHYVKDILVRNDCSQRHVYQ